MAKKNILVCSAQVPFILGGAELHVNALVAQLKKRGFEVDTLKLPFKDYPKDNLIKSAMMWRMLDAEEYFGKKVDLVIGTKFPSYVVKHSNKVVWLIHQYRQIYDLYGTRFSDFDDSIPEFKRVRQAIVNLDNVTLGEARAIFTNAQNTANRLYKFNRLTGEALYHPPMHYGRYYNSGYGDYVLSVGRLEKIKRVDLLIKAMIFTSPGVKCLIAGTGSEMDNLKQLTYSLGLADRVEFLGFVADKDLLDLYANCFAVYFAPFDEDYGYITLEAFFSKKPVITAFDSGGSLEFVKDGVNGFVCDKDEKAFGQCIEELFINKKKAAEFGFCGYDAVRGITWENVIDKLTATI